ncbi:MAG: TIGR03086 family metal-binding protein [Marmoricola sp.]
MSTRDHLHSVVATLQPVIHGVSATDTGAQTPCTDWDVRAVANHMLGTVEAMRRVGAREALDREDPWGTSGDHLRDEWRRDLSDLLVAYADAWSQPDAWEGDAMDGAVPRQVIGDMGFVEVMLHGWDLAQGSGQDVQYDEAAVDRALEVMDEIGEQGRSQGAFGTEVPVADDAPAFDQVLGKAGRDPGWAAG